MMTTTIGITIGAVIGLVALSAFFSGSETALTATSRARMHELQRRGSRRASIVQRLIGMPERLLGAILLGNNLVNILASALATSLFVDLFGASGVVYATLIMTALDQVQDRIKGIEAGADDCLDYPEDWAKLHALIDRYLSRAEVS